MAIIGKSLNILLLEDEYDLGETLKEMLEAEGYFVEWVSDGVLALDASYERVFDLYIFDINVPEINGLTLLEGLREADDRTTTIFISALIDLNTIKKAFSIGAEDYIKKPFFPEELLLRIASKFSKEKENIFYKNLSYNPQNKTLKKEGENIFLSKKQQALFHLFMSNLNQTLETEIIMEYSEIKNLSALRVAINKLKLLTGIEIRSIHGIGYRVEAC